MCRACCLATLCISKAPPDLSGAFLLMCLTRAEMAFLRPFVSLNDFSRIKSKTLPRAFPAARFLILMYSILF